MSTVNVASALIVVAAGLAVFLQFKDREPQISTEQEVRDYNAQHIERQRASLQAALDADDQAIAELRQTIKERECERHIYNAPEWGRCMGIETVEWCDLPPDSRATLIRMGATGRSCQEGN